MDHIDPNLTNGGIGSAAVFFIWLIVRNLKVFIKLSQTQWERNTDGRLTKIDGVIEDLKKDTGLRRSDFDELKKSVTMSLARIETFLPAIRKFIETVEKREERFEALKTEVIELAKEVRLIRNKKD